MSNNFIVVQKQQLTFTILTLLEEDIKTFDPNLSPISESAVKTDLSIIIVGLKLAALKLKSVERLLMKLL